MKVEPVEKKKNGMREKNPTVMLKLLQVEVEEEVELEKKVCTAQPIPGCEQGFALYKDKTILRKERFSNMRYTA